MLNTCLAINRYAFVQCCLKQHVCVKYHINLQHLSGSFVFLFKDERGKMRLSFVTGRCR